MKKIILSSAVAMFLCGCAYEAVYNNNAQIAPIDESIKADKTLQKVVIYVDKSTLKSQNFRPSSRLGNDESLDINLGEFASKATLRFLKNHFVNVEISDNAESLNTNDLVVIPEIRSFRYGFYSADGFDVTAKPFVSYELNFKMFKNQKLLYNKNISANEKNYGESEFYGSGNLHHSMIAPIFQKAIANDFNLKAREIIDTINLAN